ncbi:hypothetical protein GQ44DRAFT_756449 [Phaeosphaeriaceae sp. PMI808]|nr:hypothetical protein GQ44DRAFT_756449 [Phaeosphaeriaceae sp. PMI808]
MKYSVLFTLFFSHALATTNFVPSNIELDLVLRHIGEFDIDLVHVDARGDEDVVYLQRREPAPAGEDNGKNGDSCKNNDCVKWTAWASSSREKEELRQSEENDGSEMRRSLLEDLDLSEFDMHTLIKRGKPKEGEICKRTKIDGKSTAEGPIKFKSYSYPDNKNVEKLKKVYDFEDYDQPNTKEWYTIKNIENRVAGRSYAVEHILEWQMLLRFFEGKKAKTNAENEGNDKDTGNTSDDSDGDDDGVNDGELCKVLHEYWKNPIKFEVVQKVRQGKAWIDTTTPTKLNEMPLDFVAHAYPGGTTLSPYTDEFVILEHEVNSRKEHLWAGNSLSPSLAMAGGKPSMNNKENSKTMQFNIEHNKWWDDTKSAPGADSKENEGRCQGIGKFRTILGVYQYHLDDSVQKYFKAQVERVEKALKVMDEDVLPKQTGMMDTNGKPRPVYKPLGLSAKWKTFMKNEFDHRKIKIEEWLKVWAEQLEKIQKGKSVKDLGKMFSKRATQNWTNMCGTAVDDEVIERIKIMLKQYEDVKGKWKNPF